MASTKEPRHALASYEWIKAERSQANDETAKHIEDFGYSVTHELEWLNEKMAEVFSADAKTLTDIFKTPGRLRNKTPHTARKPTALTPRAPLSNIFATTNAQQTPSATQKISVIDHAPAFKLDRDVENQEPGSKPSNRSKSPQRAGKSGNTDSGYHGMTEDEMEGDVDARVLQNALQEEKQATHTVPAKSGPDDTAQSSEESFESARESLHLRKTALESKELSAEQQVRAEIAQPTQEDSDEDHTNAEAVEDEVYSHSPLSDTEEAERASNRKSSFNFSSLPAREPLLGKKSLGARQSHFDGTSQTSLGGKTTQKQLSQAADVQQVNEAKSTTQLLHERITMLGQVRNARTSKSLAPTVQYPELPSGQQASIAPQHVEELQSQITVPEPAQVVHEQIPRPVSMMSLNAPQDHNTPSGSPSSKKQYDGPLSASKNRLMSVFKSARSIFASSASASAAAKLEAHNATPSRDVSYEPVMNMPGALQSDASLARSLSRPISIISTSPSRKTRNSNESDRKREKELKSRQKAEAELEKMREKERAKAAREQEEQNKAEQAEAARREIQAQKAAKSTLPLAGKLRSVGRPVRPVNAPKEKPAPVNVKTGSQLQHNEAASQSRPTSSMRPSSAHGTTKISSLQSTKTGARAVEAAARKKELEEKEKVRRQQQKKELERKRAVAKAEEERKAADEARAAALKQAEFQAAEAKRREQQRLEQEQRDAQRQHDEAQKLKAAQELAEAIARERAQQQAQIRSDITGTIRQLGQKQVESGLRPPIQTNPVKPAKRPLNDADETTQARSGPAYQQNEGKRRKTDENVEVNQRASVMAPPKRPSTIRKETLTRFPMGYAQAPPAHPPTTLFKTTVANQHHSQHGRPPPTHPSQTVQMSNARIPFAESSKPSVAVPSGYPGAEHGNGKFKTPVRPAQGAIAAKSAAKSSPMYPNGDNIALPEIATDSEEEDDDDDNTGFRAPSWVASPALRDLLTQQQLVDPESVFGPIGELRMEEVFKNAKNPERLKKFRDRGSSAAWIQNGDAVTSAEKRRDMELRERVAREGGWRYEPGL